MIAGSAVRLRLTGDLCRHALARRAAAKGQRPQSGRVHQVCGNARIQGWVGLQWAASCPGSPVCLSLGKASTRLPADVVRVTFDEKRLLKRFRDKVALPPMLRLR